VSLTSFVIAAFAVWRLTHLLHAEDGPWRLAARARAALGDGAASHIVGCFYCLSVWVALLVAPWLSGQPLDLLVATAGLSGAAIVIERISGAFERHAQAEAAAVPEPPPAARWHEDPADLPPTPATPEPGNLPTDLAPSIHSPDPETTS
jgi:hypothetical protein